jgi:DNA-binding PadR family transcriptional regulator
MDDANQEILEEYVSSWVEMHKKSALQFVILYILSVEPLWAKDVQARVAVMTDWQITERGLYRLLQRMEKQGLLEHVKQDAPKTGADRKIYRLTHLGESLLHEMSGELQYLDKLHVQ